MTELIVPNLRLRYEGEGEFKATHHGLVKHCDKVLVVGQIYRFDLRQDRSESYHRLYFSALNEAWANLPEPWSVMFPTVEHLRKYALIKAGWYDTHSVVTSSAAEAQRLRLAAAWADEYAVVTIAGSTVTIYRARSQSFRAQDRAQFNEIAPKVLAVVADMIGVTTDSLAARAAA